MDKKAKYVEKIDAALERARKADIEKKKRVQEDGFIDLDDLDEDMQAEISYFLRN